MTFYIFDVLQFGQRRRARPALERPPAHPRRPRCFGRPQGTGGPPFGPPTAPLCTQPPEPSKPKAPCQSGSSSAYRPGRSRQWLKAKHSKTETFQVAGWRPSTPSRPGGLILAEHDDPIAVATLAIADSPRPPGPPTPPLRPATSHRHHHHPRRLPHRHRPLHLPHPHPRTSPRSIRSSCPTGRARANVRWQDWLAQTATVTNTAHRGGVVPGPDQQFWDAS